MTTPRPEALTAEEIDYLRVHGATAHTAREVRRLIPRFLATLDAERAARQTPDTSELRAALEGMVAMWDSRKSIDPGIVGRRGVTIRKARAALAATATVSTPEDYRTIDPRDGGRNDR